MDRQHKIVKLVIILFINIIHRTSGAEDCFPNSDDIDGYCSCSDFRSNTQADSVVSCNVRDVSSGDIFWNKFSQITGSPKTITVTVMEFEVSYFPSIFFINLPAAIQEVKLKDWSFESIPKIPVAKVNSNSSSLMTLEINDNEKLTTISPFAFASLNSLTRLALSSNSLSNLTAFSFYNLIKLRDLMLDQNKIVSLPDGIFKSLEGLGNLSIAQNEIASIKRETFVGLNSLQDLDLNRNKLLIIKNDTFRGMKKLRALDLSHNQIDTIEQAAFRGLVALDHLDLSHNQLRNLPNGAFKYSDSISTLDLKNNQLTRLDFDLFKQLPKFAYLKDNPWICDCSLFIYIEKIVDWNKETRCDTDVDFNKYRQPVKHSTITFSEYASEIAKNPVKVEKCKEMNKTIEKRSHKVAANYNAKFINSSGNQLMPFMSFIFLMLLLPGLDN